jgi:hypothetical protein
VIRRIYRAARAARTLSVDVGLGATVRISPERADGVYVIVFNEPPFVSVHAKAWHPSALTAFRAQWCWDKPSPSDL